MSAVKIAGAWVNLVPGSGVNQTVLFKTGGVWVEGNGTNIISLNVRIAGNWTNEFQAVSLAKYTPSGAVTVAATEAGLPATVVALSIDGGDIIFKGPSLAAIDAAVLAVDPGATFVP